MPERFFFGRRGEGRSELRASPYAEFLEDRRDVRFDRAWTQCELLGDLPRRTPGRDELRNLELSCGEYRMRGMRAGFHKRRLRV